MELAIKVSLSIVCAFFTLKIIEQLIVLYKIRHELITIDEAIDIYNQIQDEIEKMEKTNNDQCD